MHNNNKNAFMLKNCNNNSNSKNQESFINHSFRHTHTHTHTHAHNNNNSPAKGDSVYTIINHNALMMMVGRYSFNSQSDFETVRELKDNLCYVA